MVLERASARTSPGFRSRTPNIESLIRLTSFGEEQELLSASFAANAADGQELASSTEWAGRKKRTICVCQLQHVARVSPSRTAMSSSCEHLLNLLKDCLLHSDCVMKEFRLPSDCIRNHINDLPAECQSLRKAVFNCKHGMLDMRKRFRGNEVGYKGSGGVDHSAPQDLS